jgi:hypothetical protein
MRHRNVLNSFIAGAAIAALAVGSGRAGAQLLAFSTQEWLLHRGTPTRQGLNSDPGLPNTQHLDRVWIYPQTQDMLPEIVVDNTTLPVPAPAFPGPSAAYPANTQDFTVQGAWTYPDINLRTGGAWPPTDPTFTKLGDYIYTDAVQSQALATIGTSVLQNLPNLSDAAANPVDPADAVTLYKQINDALVADTKYARWSFGTTYPYGTQQGQRQISYFKNPLVPAPVDFTDYHQMPLAIRQRYAVYIRFPSSGTIDANGDTRPNVNHAMVRVSWGANPDDAASSRIFMINMGSTGGAWVRIRRGPGDDRYFPYDGTHPIRVTLYSLTPDDPNDVNQFGKTAIVTADSVRLVPEALRGDIHGGAVSTTVDLTNPGVTPPLGVPNRNTQLTYFGRDETTGPEWVSDVTKTFEAATNRLLYPPTGLPTLPWDPTKPGNNDPTSANFNPILDDPTTSVRSAVFYCIQDQLAVAAGTPTQANGTVRWRHPANPHRINPVTVDNETAGKFVADPVFVLAPGGGGPFNTTALVAPVTSAPTVTATWTTTLPVTAPNQKWSVFVWIPAGTVETYANYAHYQITVSDGNGGTVNADYTLNQNTLNATVLWRAGAWRQLAGGIRFPGVFSPGTVNNPTAIDQSYAAAATVTVFGASPLDVSGPNADPARLVVADAVQFVPESQSSSSSIASPLLANVDWGNAEPPALGSQRQVVYFATTDGRLWALDALGTATAAPNQPFTTTTTYWTYPSIGNPDPLFANHFGDANVPGAFRGVQDDPNVNDDPTNNRANRGIDADLARTTVNGGFVYSTQRGIPAIGGWRSSPVMVRVNTTIPPAAPVYQKYLVIANQDGRLYAFDPVGRMNALNNPFPLTAANGDILGIPGTTRRLLTWPSLARDKWLRRSNTDSEFAQYTDDAGKGAIEASPSVDALSTDPYFIASRAIFGAADGHVYAVDVSYPSLKPNERISRSNMNNTATDGQPLWLYPDDKTQLDSIAAPGALSTDFARYVFTVGGRVYSIGTTAAALPGGGPGTPTTRWIFPFTATPPRNPGANDQIPEDNEFTAPVIATPARGFNNNNESVFIANKDGRVFAFDNTVAGNVANLPIFTSTSQGGTRAPATYLDSLLRQDIYNTRNPFGPAILLPLDTGAIIGIDILQVGVGGTSGGLFWSFPDAIIGGVPLNSIDSAGVPTIQPVLFGTSNAYRGGEAITSNHFVFQGDEGNQDTGELNGQMRAYGTETLGLVSGGEPNIRPVSGGVELRMVDLWNGTRDIGAPNQVWDLFGLPVGGLDPYDQRVKGNQKANTKGNFVIYEWGDTIYMAAWGYYSGNAIPQVTFTISSTTNVQVQAIVTPDLAYAGPQLFTTDPVLGAQPATPFTAKAQYSLSLGREDFPQTPGRQYRISAFAQMNGGGGFYRTPTYYAGQFDDPAINPGPARDPNNTAPPPNGIGEPRLIAIAHPFALTTRGAATGAGLPNIVGWTDQINPDNSNTDFTEIMANGNSLATFQANAFVPTTLKDLIAPVGLVTHGSSTGYTAYNGAGQPTPALAIADRSNLFKNNQRLSRVRVERTDIHWAWDRTGNSYTDGVFGPIQKATGNVMNPLPWETFPNTIPNVSPDYPDVNRDHAAFKQGPLDMSARDITLLPPTVAGNVKTLNPTLIDLIVDAPKYQPANVNTHYFDINGVQNGVLMAPMNVANGVPGSSPVAPAPSAGYVGSYAIYVDINNDGVFQGFAPGVTQGQRVALQAREEVYRQLNVGFTVPPAVDLHTEEETVDIGTAPHGMGYTPSTLGTPFGPSYMGVYQNAQSVWDASVGFEYFKPFTVRNQGNVNLVNVRVAKVQGDYLANPANPAFWFFFGSDQVEQVYTFNNTPIGAPPYSPLAAPGSTAPYPPTAPGNIGVVSSLDHWAGETNGLGGFNRTIKWDNELWPSVVNGYTIPPALPSDYVINGNVLGWTQYSRRRPTVGKPRPGDASPRTLSIPDVYYGDPLGELASLPLVDTGAGRPARDERPKISVAVPLGMPAGTYTMPVFVFEDHVPEQWRQWIAFSRGLQANPDTMPARPGDDDGVLNTVLNNGNVDNRMIPEGRANPFNLKVTVAEARLTNGSSPGAFVEIDNRGSNPSMGANIQPVALRDFKSGNLVMYWPSNRVWNGNAWTDPGTPDSPWYLFSTQLTSSATPAQSNTAGYFDWSFEPISGQFRQWWDPMPQASQYPTPTAAIQRGLFPSQTADLLPGAPPATPLVPGNLNELTIRHATPALAQDDDPNNGTNAGTWLFWQGAASKSATNAAASAFDTRTFYVPLTNGIAPDPATTPPFSFLNDPGLPKYAPKPLIVTDQNANKLAFLFWYGGEQGRSKLYYNSNNQMGNVTTWSADTALQTPGALQYQSDPTPIHRRVFTTWFNPQGEVLDCIDLVYTGVLSNRRQAETMLTRYALGYPRDANGATTSNTPTGRLIPIPVGVQDAVPNGQTPTSQTAWNFGVLNELAARQGNSTTWTARDVAWLYSANRWDAPNNRFRRDLLDANGNPYFSVTVVDKAGNATNVLQTNFANPPTFDTATGKIYINSALGGRVIIDPQAGTITFNGVSPTGSDKVLISYTPETLRLNVSRNATGALTVPNGNDPQSNVPWANDPGFAARGHVEPSGPDTQPVSFLDLSRNPRFRPGLSDNTVFAVPNGQTTVPVTRMWLFFRKTEAAANAPSTIWYKTMRLMVRLPRGVLRDPDGTIGANITVTGNQGPYEVDWVRGRVYFTEVDEGRPVQITFAYARDNNGNKVVAPQATYRVGWGDEISSAVAPGDATTNERVLPLSTPVNEGQVSAFKDPFQDKVWVFWSSTRAGTTDLYYMTLNPQLYTQPGF